MVVIIAIVGTILGGTALGADEVTRTSTDYSYVTDISGLFPYSDEPMYSEYNPASNLTGFYTGTNEYTSGIDYTAATSLSNYPIKQQQPVYNGSQTLSKSSTSQIIIQCKVYPDAGEGNSAFYYTVNQPYMMSLSEALSPALSSISNLSKFTFSVGSYTDFGPVIAKSSDLIQSPNNPSWSYIKWYPTLYNVDSYEYEYSTQAFKALDASGTVVWQTNFENVIVMWGGTVNNNTTGISKNTLSNVISYNYTKTITPIYLDPAYGVSIQAGDKVSWKNGYTNSKVSLMFIGPQDDTKVYKTQFWIYNDNINVINNMVYGKLFTIESYYDEIVVTTTLMQVNNTTHNIVNAYTSKEMSFNRWNSIRIDIDCINDKYTITPIGPTVGQAWPTFQNYIEYPSLSVSNPISEMKDSQNGLIWNSMIKEILFQTDTQSLDLVIKDTSVFMDTYINVIYNDSFYVSDYFPDVAYPRVDIKSVAMYGSTIYINQKWFGGLEDGYIHVFDINGREMDILFDNVRIAFGTESDNHAYMTFLNDNVVVDLGEVSKTVGSFYFGGAWYLAADLYEGKTVTTTGYEFNPLQWAFDSNTAIIFYLGLLALCSIIGARYSNFGWGDIILVSCAGIVGFLILV